MATSRAGSGIPMSRENYAQFGAQVRTLGSIGVPTTPGEWMSALFGTPGISNRDIAQALTEERSGTKWNSAMRSAQRWRATYEGGGKEGRRPSKANMGRLARSSTLRRRAGILPPRVEAKGQIELVYDGVSQGTRDITNVQPPIQFSGGRLAEILRNAGGRGASDEDIGIAVAHEIYEAYRDGNFPTSLYLGDDTDLALGAPGE